MDDADLRELLAVFRLDAPGRLERIERCLEPPADPHAAANEAHSLSGAAATVGLYAVAAEAELLEAEVHDGVDPRQARRRLATLSGLLAGLDVADAPAEAARATAEQDRTVLQVEDNPVNAALVERVLARRPNVRLLTAPTSDAAVRVAREARPDLILLDLSLPDGSGADLLRRLRAESETRDVPVVVVTGHTPDRSADALRDLGVREHLTKPIDVGRLLELVDELAPASR